ncbi:MAG: ribosome-binding factor A [Deltaproteobacteria bacterium CG11_big_fil_rev_8_21_14_0_20_45_16]|nr:MAG: ribosome-binding factor A [Deltaproteobacteria bacterium CG11_big_fil_rev_8_21_14_0_20_45_16]
MSIWEKKHRFKRSDRIESLIREELAQLIPKSIRDPRVSNLTIIGVEMRPDAKSAVVRVSKMMSGEFREPDATEERELIEGLSSASGFLFEQLRRRISIRHIPRLEFEYDDSIAKSAKVWSLLNKIAVDKLSEKSA